MAIPLPIRALVEAARKRALLATAAAERLGAAAAARQLAEPADLAAWLGGGEGLSSALARKLKALLPPPTARDLGPYQPLAHLADGGMGSVWLARRREAGDDLVVVKTIRAAIPGSITASQADEFTRRFAREAEITRGLDHPNIVRCLDSGSCPDGTLFMVLEYIDAGDLRDLVDARSGIPEPLALAIALQICAGLGEAHRLRLVHRDIKPPNIFVSSAGLVKLADFGIARSTEIQRTVLTMQGAVVGSPLYMSPEQILADPGLDIRSDIYAVGALLHYCLTGAPPFGGRMEEVLRQHCNQPPPDPRAKVPDLSAATAAIVATAMAKRREERFPHPAAMEEALLAALAGLGGGSQHSPTPLMEALRSLRDRPPAPAGMPASCTATLDTVVQTGDDRTLTVDWTTEPAAGLHTTIATGGSPSGGADPSATATATRPTATRPVPSARDPGETLAWMTAQLMADRAPPEDPASGQQDTLATRDARPQAAPAAGLPSGSDLAQALSGPWITLLAGAGGPPAAILVAKTRILLGKLRDAPVDLCLRNYPVSVHKESCQRISRQHCALVCDAVLGCVLVQDLEAPNGTLLNGIALPAGGSASLPPATDSTLSLAGVVTLRLRVVPRRHPPLAAPSATPDRCGLEATHAVDALAITRPENHPQLAYAQVLRRIAVGGPGADLVLAGARTRGSVELALVEGRWIWRPGDAAGDWRPLMAGAMLDAGGQTLMAVAGDYGHF